ncbi:MAG: TRAP transporter large permease [Tissierellia bacterium]|nr:TRAP transporter large permease [Tissierellia bacterium]
MSISLILFGTFIILLFLNVPIAISLGLSSLAAMIAGGIPLSMLPMQIHASIGKFTLLAIPFFILAGNVMEKAGISSRLIDLAEKLVGHKKSGLAIVAVITSVFFAAISGSGPATVAALGAILIPAMINNGYEEGMAASLMATAGAIGIIIPPSIAFVVYGAIAEQSIGKLFIAGIVPGLLIGAALIIASIIVCKDMPIKQNKKATGKEKWAAFKEAFWGLMMPVIILGGIYGGIFTPTEAAAVSAVYGILVGVFIYKQIDFKEFVDLLVESSVQSAVVLLIVATASVFAWIVTTEGIADAVGSAILTISAGNKILFLLLVNIILLITGCFLDAISAFYLFVPILLPVAIELGYDPIAFGVVMTVNLAIGQVTPPVGVNLYVACPIADIDLKTISKSIVPFLAASIAVLLLITYFPQTILWLPNLMKIK